MTSSNIAVAAVAGLALACGLTRDATAQPDPGASSSGNTAGSGDTAGSTAGNPTSGGSGAAAVGDYNNDGFEDLFVTYWGQNALYRNNGDGTFTDVTKASGLLSSQPRFGSGCTFLDYDRDGRLDLFVSNYVAFDIESVPRAGASKSFTSPGWGNHRAQRNPTCGPAPPAG